jgi:signal transduction histidine kinase
VQLRTTADEAATICPVDRQRIQQVFRNILENALEVAPDGSEVEISCRSTQLRGQPALAITVRDSGPGISPADRERVFEPFFSTKTKGTGLGMAIARRIVEAHGGTITVAVNDSPGAAIRVMLPR